MSSLCKCTYLEKKFLYCFNEPLYYGIKKEVMFDYKSTQIIYCIMDKQREMTK